MSTVDLRGTAAGLGGSDRLSGYLAQPTTEGPWPGVVLVHEAFGPDEAMMRHTERIAGMGYLALMPDLFSDGGTRRCLASTLRAMGSGEGRAYADIEAARQWLLQRADCTGKIGIIGFCMGGGFALMTVGTGFDAAAANYGPLPKDLDAALAGACPVVGSYGGKDRSLKGAAGRLDAALSKVGVVHEVTEYPGAGHSFLNDAPNGPRLLRPLVRVMGVGPEPVSAAEAWQRIESFFATQLGPTPQDRP